MPLVHLHLTTVLTAAGKRELIREITQATHETLAVDHRSVCVVIEQHHPADLQQLGEREHVHGPH